MMDELEIITTSDGSHSLRNRRLNETYHSVHGALQESMHVFIRNGLQYFHQGQMAKSISVLEIGFGTGLNALLTWEYAREHKLGVRYTTLEPFPLVENVWSKLNYAHRDSRRFRLIHEAAWDKAVLLSAEFTLRKRRCPLAEANLDEPCDVIYFDAFAPSVQPELWSHDALKLLTRNLNNPGVFVTYSAKGQLKRDLRDLGLKVETLPGPPGKTEMVRGINLSEASVNPDNAL